MLSRMVITFLPRSKHLLISRLQSPSAVILEPRKIKASHCFHCFPIYFPWSDAMILVFWMLSLKPTFSLSSFSFIKRLFSSSSLILLPCKSSIWVSSLCHYPSLFEKLVLLSFVIFSWRRNSWGLDSILGLFRLITLGHLSNGLWTPCLVPMKTTTEGYDPLQTGQPWRSYLGYS